MIIGQTPILEEAMCLQGSLPLVEKIKI